LINEVKRNSPNILKGGGEKKFSPPKNPMNFEINRSNLLSLAGRYTSPDFIFTRAYFINPYNPTP